MKRLLPAASKIRYLLEGDRLWRRRCSRIAYRPLHERENISRFPDAILRLAAEFNVSDELKKDVNKPTFAERDATIDEKMALAYLSSMRSSLQQS